MALVLAYLVFIHTAFTYIPLRTSFVFRIHCFTSITLLHHLAHIITHTSLQLHHHTYIIKLTSITSLHFIYITSSKLITSFNSITYYSLIISLHHPRIPSISPVTIHLPISTGTQFPHSAPKFVPISISNNIWDTSKLLLLSGDVETNPEPRLIDESTVFCSICSSKTNREIQQDTAPTCHQACNGLTTNQTRHAKSSGRTITCKCPQYGTSIAKIIIPSPPSSRPSAAGKLCSVCNNPIRYRYADLAYHPSCANICHLSAACSGFVSPRGITRAHILSTRIWHCHLHSLPIATGHSSTQHDTCPACPTPLSSNSPLNQESSVLLLCVLTLS